MRTAVATDDEGPDPKVVERVHRLRALAASTTFVPERESALAKAAELMFQHGLTETDLEPPAPPQRFIVLTPFGPREVDEATYRRIEAQERAREKARMRVAEAVQRQWLFAQGWSNGTFTGSTVGNITVTVNW